MRIIAKQRCELARAIYCHFVSDVPQEMFLFIDETAKDKKKLQVDFTTFGEIYFGMEYLGQEGWQLEGVVL